MGWRQVANATRNFIGGRMLPIGHPLLCAVGMPLRLAWLFHEGDVSSNAQHNALIYNDYLVASLVGHK
jgi:hypothetical protein